MNEYYEQYQTEKQRVLNFMDECIDFLSTEQKENVSSLCTFRENVEKEQFSIVLVGEFSAGKSMFLNALMNKRILPSFTTEATATINFLRSAKEAPDGVLGKIYYKDGSIKDVKELHPEYLERVCSTRGDGADGTIADTVDRIELFLDSEFLNNGVMLVDSPGLNGVADKHREITEQQIRSSHASIFMFNAQQPGSATNFRYLQELKNQSNHIFFLLNKIDVIQESEGQTVEDVIDRIRATYQSQFPEEKTIPKIWPVAAFSALVARDPNFREYLNGEIVETDARRQELEKLSGMKQFEDRLWKYLTQGERTRDQLISPVEAAMNQLKIRKEQIEGQIKAMQNENCAESLEKQRQILDQKKKEQESSRQFVDDKLKKSVRTCISEKLEKITTQCEKFRSYQADQIKMMDTPEELQTFAAELSEKLEGKKKKIVQSTFNELTGEFLEIVAEQYDNRTNALEEKIETFMGEKPLITPTKLDVKAISFDVNLEAYQKREKELSQEIEVLQDEADRVHEDWVLAKRYEREVEEKRRELQRLSQSKQTILQTMLIPEVYNTQEESTEDRDREGLFGRIANFLVGPKRKIVIKNVEHRESHDEALEQRDQYIGEVNRQIRDINEDLKSGVRPKQDSMQCEAQEQQKRMKADHLQRQIQEERQEIQRKLDREYSKACKSMRNDINRQMEEILDEFSGELKCILNEKKNAYIHAVDDLLNIKLDKEIEEMQVRLNELDEKIHQNAEDKQREENNLHEMLNNLVTLQNSGMNLWSQLNDKLDDHVEQECLG